jgi:hypothetical protein
VMGLGQSWRCGLFICISTNLNFTLVTRGHFRSSISCHMVRCLLEVNSLRSDFKGRESPRLFIAFLSGSAGYVTCSPSIVA